MHGGEKKTKEIQRTSCVDFGSVNGACSKDTPSDISVLFRVGRRVSARKGRSRAMIVEQTGRHVGYGLPAATSADRTPSFRAGTKLRIASSILLHTRCNFSLPVRCTLARRPGTGEMRAAAGGTDLMLIRKGENSRLVAPVCRPFLSLPVESRKNTATL